MKSIKPENGYSAEIRVELRARGKVFEIAKVGPNRFVPREPMELDACDAEIVMFVDGDQFLWPVRLPNGAYPFERSVHTVARGEMQRLGPAELRGD